MVRFSSALLACAAACGVAAFPTGLTDAVEELFAPVRDSLFRRQGGGFYWSFWNDGKAKVKSNNKSGGEFSFVWTDDVG
jgi:hypothetical protein